MTEDLVKVAKEVANSIDSILFIGNDFMALKDLWEKNQVGLKLIDKDPALIDPINFTKEHYKELIREKKIDVYRAARLRCFGRLVYVRCWKIMRDDARASGRNDVLNELEKRIYNYVEQERAIKDMTVRYEIDYCKACGFQLIEINNGVECVLGMFPTQEQVETEMQAYILAGSFVPSIDNSEI